MIPKVKQIHFKNIQWPQANQKRSNYAHSIHLLVWTHQAALLTSVANFQQIFKRAFF